MSEPSRTVDTKVSINTIVQLFYSRPSGLIAIVAEDLRSG